MKKSRKIFFSLFSVILLVAAGIYVTSSLLKKTKIGEKEYSALIQTNKKRISALEGERTAIYLKLKNTGRKTWSSRGSNPCFVSFHLLDDSGKIIQFDNQRFPFPLDVRPPQEFDLAVPVRPPLDAGEYVLEFDLLREGISWFKDYGSQTCRIDLKVTKRAWPEDNFLWSLEKGAFTKFHSSVAEFNTLGKLIRLTLENNRIDFKGRTGKVSFFTPGVDYPQVWLRDANTILPLILYFYESSHLTSWLEEHLSFQKADGSLEDWIDSSGESGKNTTETDQETSAVQSAHRVFTLRGPAWLKKRIEEQEIIHRLDRALLYVLDNRFDPKFGLVTGAHTADWGDVDIVDSDERALDVDDRTQWTVDIYDQSMFYLASLQLGDMFAAVGQEQKASFWRTQAETIRANTDKWLWNKEKGFYRIHLHLEDWEHDFDEENILAMGGNCMAILSGISGEEKAAAIIERILERQKTFQVSTISGTLLPPYPENVFRHPLLDAPFEYQNGGQWDWFGGRFIQAMFREGFSDQGREKLIEIAIKNMTHRCLFEWDDRLGTGRGSEDYSGSAGSLGQALFEGYFGILWTEDSFHLQPRLGRDSGRIHVFIPAADTFIAYEYIYFPEEERIEFSFNSDSETKGKIRLLSPWKDLGNESNEGKGPNLFVRLDEIEIPFSLQHLNSDTYIVLETDFKHHTLSIQKVRANNSLPF
jgi:hypothetical protein